MNFRKFQILSTRLVSGLACGVLLGAHPAMATAAGSTWKVETGYYYSSGDYGLEDDTTISGVPVSLRYRGWPWRVKLSTMWVALDGLGTLTDGDVAGGRVAVPRKEKGWGDTSLTLDREGLFLQRKWYWNAGVRIKFPTGSEKAGLGTGEFDYEPRFTLMYLSAPVKPYVMGRYTFKGDNETRRYENTLGATVGASYQLSPSISMGAQLTGRESSVKNGNDRLEALVNGSWKIDEQLKVGGYVIKGLQDGSPDWGGGLAVSYQWKNSLHTHWLQ